MSDQFSNLPQIFYNYFTVILYTYYPAKNSTNIVKTALSLSKTALS